MGRFYNPLCDLENCKNIYDSLDGTSTRDNMMAPYDIDLAVFMRVDPGSICATKMIKEMKKDKSTIRFLISCKGIEKMISCSITDITNAKRTLVVYTNPSYAQDDSCIYVKKVLERLSEIGFIVEKHKCINLDGHSNQNMTFRQYIINSQET
jgi:hypothetical protein